MKIHSQEYKTKIKKFGRELDSKISYELNGETIELGTEELNSITPTFQANILKSVMKELDIDSNVDIPLGTIINYKFGVLVDDEYEYLDYGNYIVYSSEKQEDLNSYKIVCYDFMLRAMNDYNGLQTARFPLTVKQYINALCNDLSISFANNNDNFANSGRVITSDLYKDLGYTYRDIFDELAQVTASTICINDNNKLEIRYINNTNDSINEEYLKNINVNFGEKYGPINSIVLSRAGGSDNIYLNDQQSIDENGLCEIKISDNQIMNFNDRSDYLPDILYKLNGLEYYINDFSSTGITYYDLCDKYNVIIGDNSYPCIMFNDEINITQGLEENVYTEMPEQSETDYTKSDKTDRKINQTYLIVDKQNQQIEAVINQADEQNQKIAKVTQTVDELNSKISDIADITTSNESNLGKIDLSNINQSEPIRVQIRPIGENISYLYPNSNLYSNDILFPKVRTVRFENTKTNEIFDYALPNDLFYYDEENFDEFILDYDGQSIVINKRVGLNDDGTTYILDNPTTIEYEYPRILLTDGDYTVSLLGYDNAYIFVRLMSQNIYTTQFATKAELNSEITQTANSIISEVTGKINTIDNELSAKLELKVDTNKLISEINASADVINLKSNRLIIDSNNFKLTADGKITSTSGKLGGYDIGATNLSADISWQLPFSIATQSEFQNVFNKITNYANGTGSLTAQELKLYDVNGDGIVDKLDSLMISRIYYGYLKTSGKLLINSGNYKETLCFKDDNENTLSYIGLAGISTNYFSAEQLSVSGTSQVQDLTVNGYFTNNSDKRLKKDIKELSDNYIDVIKEATPVEFTYKKNDTRHIGFIAQDLEKVFQNNKLEEIPIQKDEIGMYSIDYISLIGILWKSNQDLYKKIETLESKIKESENK